MALKILCFVFVEINKIGTSLNGEIASLIRASYFFDDLVFFSIKSHLLTNITTPLLFRCASQNMF